MVLISGRGSNMSALTKVALDPSFPGEVVAVFSDRADAGGLEAARNAGIPAKAIARQDFLDRTSHEAALMAATDAARADIVCLAGYMRLLSAAFVEHFAGRIINIHPSLLPLFPGLHTHDRALAAGVRLHGASVHFVTFEMDEGPIIAQAAVPVYPTDTAAELAARVLTAEHHLYAQAVKMVLGGEVRLADGRAVFSRAILPDPTGPILFSPPLA